MHIKIIGAGSIGNHLAQASRRMGWGVTIVDVDEKALLRTKNEIYPTRYGAWDSAIKLSTPDKVKKGGFDIIMIGTPPQARMKLALEALKEGPKILQLEKPLTMPFDKGLRAFLKAYRAQKKTKVVLGYDHAIGKSIQRVAELLKRKSIGEVLTLDVEFREHWHGIFKAHPWLKGPEDTYLGFWKKGGGASGEHSHALHLFQYLAKEAGLGTWTKVSSMLKVEKKGKAEYDSLAAFMFELSSGKTGRVVQDVVTLPTRKWIRVQGNQGFIEWFCNGHATGDLIRFASKGGEVKEEIFSKKRPDDFFEEMLHIQAILDKEIKPKDSPISLESGVSVMEVLETAWKNTSKSLQSIKNI
ncbi:MAG: Gfo/Idh/MocA family oxidoreductase [bacterium]|nr:Gfo/Idh/MocA family oxidoreductase [bacterium]